MLYSYLVPFYINSRLFFARKVREVFFRSHQAVFSGVSGRHRAQSHVCVPRLIMVTMKVPPLQRYVVCAP